jgi:hypothetical protein
MNKALNIAIALNVCLALSAAPAVAAKPKKKDRAANPAARIEKKIDAAQLPTESQAKAKKVVQEHAAKLKEAQAKVDAVLTAEQKQARKQAVKEARAAGKKRKELQAAVEAKLKLTPEQKSKLASAEAELKQAQNALTKDLRGVLSAEEVTKVGLRVKKKA